MMGNFNINCMALNKVDFFKKKLDIFKIICYNNTMEIKMIDKIIQVVLEFFGKEKPEPPTEENNESLEALEKVEALDKIGEPL